MTIAAALRIEGVPALIGDFLTTDERLDVSHAFMPTRPDINDGLSPPLPRRIHGFRRKLHLVNESFIVGFVGDLNAAAAVLGDLQRRFGHTKSGPTIDEIDQSLRMFDIQFRGRVTIIGWTIRSRPRCFRWAAELGSHAERVDFAIEGSGRNHFTRLLPEGHSGGYSPAIDTARDKAILLGLAKIGKVLLAELQSGENLRHSYGYGAELALFNGRTFEFVSGIAYCFWSVRIELDGRVRIMPANVVAAYESRGRYCVIQITHLAPGERQMVATNAYAAAISAPHDDMADLDPHQLKPLEIDQLRFYFNGIAFFDARTNLSGTIVMSAERSDDLDFRIQKRDDGLVHVEWNRAALEAWVKDAAVQAARIGGVSLLAAQR